VSGDAVTRRRFLFVALGAGVPLGLAPLRTWNVVVAFERSEPAVRLARLLTPRDGARAIGTEYLRTLPGPPASAAALADAIALALPAGHRALATAGDAELRELLAEQSAADFGDGRTVRLRGWILSETEARLCALAALLR
jgi:hypothetical protein